MKTILILLLFSLNCFAENWMPISKIEAHSNQAYQMKSECEKSGEECLDVGANPEVIAQGYFELTDGAIVVDSAAVTSHQVVLIAQAIEDAQEQNALARMACGQKVIAKLLVRNAVKNLTTEQVGALSYAYAPIQGLLLNGSLETAKSMIQAVVPDGVVVTEADKTALVEKLDSCKPQ